MVSQLREEGTGVIPRDFSSGLGTEIGPEVEESSWRWRFQHVVVVGAHCRHRSRAGFIWKVKGGCCSPLGPERGMFSEWADREPSDLPPPCSCESQNPGVLWLGKDL